MGVNNVSFDDAMASKTAALQYLRSKNVPSEEKGQLSAKWGADIVNQALSVDSTKYEIDDIDYNSAKEAGKEVAKDATGYGGGKSYRGVVDAAESAGAAVGGRLITNIGGNTAITSNTAAANAGNGKQSIAKMSDIATVLLASAVAAKYYIAKPNKTQHDAAMELYNPNGGGANVLGEGQASLNEAQGNMEEADEKVTELAEEAEEKNEEANQKIEEEKTLFDFNRQQYNALKAKKESGETLTKDEQDFMKSRAADMENLGETITETSETTSDEVNDLHDEMADYQEIYDESAETIAEVEGVTEYAEGFDENTRTMSYVEMGAQSLNALSATLAAARLSGKGIWNLVFAGIGLAAAASSGIAAGQQMKYASELTEEIHYRRDTQELGNMTNEVYDEKLDNHAGNLEFVEDLSLEIPDDTEAPTTVASDTADANNGTKDTAQPSLLNTGTDNKDDGDDKKKDDEKK